MLWMLTPLRRSLVEAPRLTGTTIRGWGHPSWVTTGWRRAVDGRDRPVLHHPGQSPALIVVQLGGMAGRLAIDEPLRAILVEGQNPILYGLKPDPADPGRIRPGASVVDLHQGQEPTSLGRVLCKVRNASAPCEPSSCRAGRHRRLARPSHDDDAREL
jgi:hypothetical protein